MKNLAVIFLWIVALNHLAYGQNTDSFRWLIGTWKMKTGSGFIVEHWTFINDSTYRGESFFVKGKDSIPQEVVELSRRKGEWSYIPTVKGQNNNKPVSFRLIFISSVEFIAENRQHDFPQRIAYRRVDKRLYASIEGNKKGKYGKQNFDYESDGY